MRGGIKDVLVSNQVRDPAKIDRLARLPKLGSRIIVCVDDVANIADLSAAAEKHGTQLEIFVEIDCGAGRCGVTSTDAVVKIAQAADAAGFDAAWASEFYSRSGSISMAAMANSTQNCRIGSSILYGIGRSPLVLATEARDLDELSNRRLVLGIGNGTKRMMSDWHGVPDTSAPALRMEELVMLLRRIWNLHEGPVHHEGRFYRMNLTPTGDVEADMREIKAYYAQFKGKNWRQFDHE